MTGWGVSANVGTRRPRCGRGADIARRARADDATKNAEKSETWRSTGVQGTTYQQNVYSALTCMHEVEFAHAMCLHLTFFLHCTVQCIEGRVAGWSMASARTLALLTVT